MKALKVLGFVVLFSGLVVSTAAPGWSQSKSEIKGPVILGTYAQDRGQYGTPWKIYIEARDSSAEMIKLAVMVDQVGYGHYPTDFIVLDPQYRNHLKGYLQWNTFSSRGADLREGDQITLRVSIIDRAGNESREMVFPFTFMSGRQNEARMPASFDQGDIPRIGHISVSLVNPGKGGGQ